MHTEFHFPTLRVEALHLGDELAMRFIGELTAQHIEPLRRHLTRLIDRYVPHVSIDLSRLEFASINGLGLLTALAHDLRQRDRRLTLIRPTRHMRDILELTRLDRVLAIDDDTDGHVLEEAPALAMA